jgi:hypothetical protein
LLYDSDQYLDDIKRFVKKQPIEWRSKNGGVCDSPNLYFAVLPNGDFAPCCDFRLNEPVSTVADNFPKVYRDKIFRKSVNKIVSGCDGCMYGSYPEMTITMRYMAAMLQRARLFLSAPPAKNWPLEYDELIDIAAQIAGKNTKRPVLRPMPAVHTEV